MVNRSGFVGSFGVVAGVIVLAGTAQGLVHHEPSVADEVVAVPAVSVPPTAAPDAYLCSVSCAAPESPLLSAGEHRARAAYWASQKVTVPRSSAGGESVSVATPKAKASQPKAAKSPTVTVTQKTSTTSSGTTTTSTTTKTTSKG